jgi:hypothetical protein
MVGWLCRRVMSRGWLCQSISECYGQSGPYPRVKGFYPDRASGVRFRERNGSDDVSAGALRRGDLTACGTLTC